VDHWDEYYRTLIKEVIWNLDTLNGVDTDKLIWSHLLAHLERAETINRRNWEIHFQLMYIADALYFQFEDYCREHGIAETDFLTMLRGSDHMPSRTDQEMWALAVEAEAAGVREVIMGNESHAVLDRLRELPEAYRWLEKFQNFLSVYGNRVVAAHMDVSTPTWREDPTPVLDTIRGYFDRIDSGWDYYASRDVLLKERDESIAAYEESLGADG
jgi:hypothetical protein